MITVIHNNNFLQVKDPIYFLNNDTYVKLTDKYYNDIIEEKIRL